MNPLLLKISLVLLIVASWVSLEAQCKANASFQYTILEQRKVQFNMVQDSAAHYWEIFDKGASYTSANPIHNFTNFGNYRVCHYITVTDSQTMTTCKDTLCSWISIPSVCTLDGNFELELNSYSIQAKTLHPELENKWYINTDSIVEEDSLNHTFGTFGTKKICHVVSYYDTILNKRCVDSICKEITLYDTFCNAKYYFSNSKGDFTFFSEDSTGLHSWFFGDGDSSKLHSPKHSFTKDSNYIVHHIVKKLDGNNNVLCTDTVKKEILVVFVNIVENNRIPTLLFPNPAKDIIHLQYNENLTGKIIITDAFGKNILEFTIPNHKSNQISIPIEHLPPGFYWIKTSSRNKSQIKSFIKE